MLNKEQTDYIDSLRITHPNVPDATLKPLFVESGWSEEEITEALTRYKKVAPPPLTPVTPPTPIQKEPVAPRPPTPSQASPVRQPTLLTPTPTPVAPTERKSGLVKFLITFGILLIVLALLGGIYFYLIQKGHINEVMRTGDIIFKSILEKI